MASFKFEIGKRFGTYRAAFFKAGEQAKEQEFQDIEAVVDYMRKESGGLNFDEDSVIFRGIAYSSIAALTREVKVAPV